MRVFLAGATGVIGRRLAGLLQKANHEVTGTTRSAGKAEMLRAIGVTPEVVDVFDAEALVMSVAAARPDIVIHQLTDLPSAPGTSGYPAAQELNRRLRIEGTRNLMSAAKLAGVRRAIAQSIWISLRAGHLVRCATAAPIRACRRRRPRGAAGGAQGSRRLQHRRRRWRRVACEGRARTRLRPGVQDSLNGVFSTAAHDAFDLGGVSGRR
jgi:hypothetical protein